MKFARELADRIRNHWADRGYPDVKVTISETEPHELRSNLVNGLPPGVKRAKDLK